MVGSSDSIASPNTTLNAIVAEAFCEAADRLEAADNLELAVHDLIKEYFTEHQRIIFNGDGYAKEWIEEAAKRGLPNIASTIDAASALTTEKAVKLFEKFGIYSRSELESREEITYETYSKIINIEALTMIDMAKKLYIPAVMRYTKTLAEAVNALREAGQETDVQSENLSKVNHELKKASDALKKLEEETSKASAIKNDAKAQAYAFKDCVKTAMDELRTPVDTLEMLVDKSIWPVPSYADLIFEV